jgi:hypothetical protein
MDMFGLDTITRRLCALSCIVVLIFSGGGFDIVGAVPLRASANAEEEDSKPSEETAGHLTNEDVIKMVKSGMSARIIIAMIKSQPVAFEITSDAIVALKKAGVSEEIIEAVVTSASGASVQIETPNEREVSLRDGTEITLRLLESVSSATARVDDRVAFEAVEDVLVDEVIVIKKGARGSGRVTEAKPKKSFGRSGKLDFSIDYVKAVDGQNIPLRYTRAEKGDDNYGKAGVVAILVGPFAFFVRGKDVEIKSGREFSIYIHRDRTIKLKPEA